MSAYVWLGGPSTSPGGGEVSGSATVPLPTGAPAARWLTTQPVTVVPPWPLETLLTARLRIVPRRARWWWGR